MMQHLLVGPSIRPRSRARALLDDVIEWDVRNWATALDFWTRNTSRDLRGCTALEIGSRHGGLSLWLALRGARVVCSDVDGPTGRAMSKHRAAGVADRVTYQAIDATRIPHANRFDIVVFKSVLGAVGRQGGHDAQAAAIAGMHRALKPRGELFFAENLVASPLHQYLRRRFVTWGNSWRYVTVPGMLDLLSPFASVCYGTAGFAGALGRTNRQRDVLGSLDRLMLDRMVPRDWRYIMLGIGRKNG